MVNAHRINREEFPLTDRPRAERTDFHYIESDDPEKVLAVIKELYTKRLPDAFHLDPRSEIQEIKGENMCLKQLIAELSHEVLVLKKMVIPGLE